MIMVFDIFPIGNTGLSHNKTIEETFNPLKNQAAFKEGVLRISFL